MLGAIALAVLFPIAGNQLYDALLAEIVGARPGTVSLIAAEPNGFVVHRAAVLASFAFLGFVTGAALAGCRRLARATGRVCAYAWLVLIAGFPAASCFALLHARAAAFSRAVRDMGIGVALPLDAFPLYPLGVVPGGCVLVHAAVLLTRHSLP